MLGLAIQLVWTGFADPHAQIIGASFAAALVGAGAALFLRVHVPFAPPRLEAFLMQLGNAWRQLRRDRGFALRCIAMLLAITGMRARRASVRTGFFW